MPPCVHCAVSLALAALLGACAGCSSGPGAPESTTDSASTSEAAAEGGASEDSNDAAAIDAIAGDASAVEEGGRDTGASDTAHDPMHQCPGCQAGKCGTELEACAGSSACVDWLMCMNECFKKPDVASCQTGCRASMGPAAKKMDDCTLAKCHDECTP